MFISVGSTEKTAVYFVIVVEIHFVNKQCLKKVFHGKEEAPPENPIGNIGNVSDPSNRKPTIVKLDELQIKI